LRIHTLRNESEMHCKAFRRAKVGDRTTLFSVSVRWRNATLVIDVEAAIRLRAYRHAAASSVSGDQYVHARITSGKTWRMTPHHHPPQPLPSPTASAITFN
jgi:hypothetical protein